MGLREIILIRVALRRTSERSARYGSGRFVIAVDASAKAELRRKWYLAFARGIAALLVGVLALTVPQPVALVIVAAYLFIDGAIAVAFGVGMGSSLWIRAAFVLEGSAGILASLFVLTHGSSHSYFVLTIATWAVVTGLLEIVGAAALPNAAWLVAVLGFVSLAFGVALFVWPSLAILSFLYLLICYAVVAAILFVLVALDLWRAYSRSA